MKNDKEKSEKIGLALSGGASKGMAIFAIIEQLEKEKIKIDMISGTSVGAIIGAYFALYGEIDTLKNEILSFSKKNWFNLVDISIKFRKSLIKGEKIKKYLKSKFGDKTFKDAKIPLVIVATNLKTGEPEYIQEGKIVDALMASSAYPGVLPPYKISRNIYVDGGILDNLPYNILFEREMDKIISINLGILEKNKPKFNSMFSIITRSIDLMISNALKKINNGRENLFIFEPKFKKGFNSTWDISKLKQKYEVGVEEYNQRRNDFLEWLIK